MASMSVIIVAPVVVRPEAVSNSASMKLGISPLITNGSAPIALSSIQPMPTMTKPSRAEMSVLCGLKRVSTKAAAAERAIVTMKPRTLSP